MIFFILLAVAAVLFFSPPIPSWFGCTWPGDYVDHMGGSWDNLIWDDMLQCYRIVKP